MSITRILVVIFVLGWSQDALADLIPQAQRVQVAHERLMSAPSETSHQLAYLKAFPNDYSEFLAVFMPSDFTQLYDGHEYIVPLKKIGKKFPEQTLNRLLPIEVQAHWDADAVNYLQEVTLEVAVESPGVFVRCLLNLPETDQRGVIVFLTDGIEGPHSLALELANRVEELGQASLAEQIRHEAKLSKKRADEEHGR